MSTRRARIKAVASLPVRRRNADNKGPTAQKPVENDASVERNERIQSPANQLDLATSPATHEVSQRKSFITSNDSDLKDNSSPAPTTTTEPQVSSLTLTDAIGAGDCTSGKELTGPLNHIKISNITTIKFHEVSRINAEKSLHFSSSPRAQCSPRAGASNLSAAKLHTKTSAEANLLQGSENHIPNLESSSEISTLKQKSAEATPIAQDIIPSSNVFINGVSKLRSLLINGKKGPQENAGPPRDQILPESPEAMVDGIVPLSARLSQTADLLKSEIISESAEVLFDPIVPLPSPGKLRPKLRPTPRLASVRRNSVQGSASESEDEHKRGMAGAGAAGAAGGSGPGTGRIRHDSQQSQSSLGTHHSQQPHVRETVRTRNDSVCSVLSHAAPTLPSSPLKEKHLGSRWKRGGGGGGGGDSTRQVAAMRRRQRARGAAVQRDQLTMYDLIFYNPTTNPILETEEAKQARLHGAALVDKKVESEAEDDPPPPPVKDAAEESAGEGEGEPEPAPVPQIKLGPNGEVIIDEQSLVIERTEGQSRQLSASVVREWGGGGGGGRYSRTARTKQWADAETVRFYRALAAIGTDFSLMLPLFPDRSRRDLKMKFKKEERNNGAQIDKALTARGSFCVEALAEQFAGERRDALEREARHAQEIRDQGRLEKEQLKRTRQLGIKLGRAGKPMVGIIPSRHFNSHVQSADDVIAENVGRAPKRKLPPARAAPAAAAPAAAAPPPAPVALRKYMSTARAYELPANANPLAVAKNVAPGSLVCLTIPDPRDPAKKVLQTYVSDGRDKLTPVNLPAGMLGSIMDYMKGGSPASRSPAAAAAALPGASPAPAPSPQPPARVRHNSYTIMNL